MLRGALAKLSAPEGFSIERSGRRLLALREDLLDSPVAAAFRDGSAFAPTESAYRGRGATRVVEAGGARFVLRRYRHGGWFRAITGERFLGPGRALRELGAYAALRRRGVPTLEPIAVSARKRRPLDWRLDLLTREASGAKDGLAYLRDAAAGPRERRAAFRAAGAAVRRLHETGFRHADLQLKNLLVVPDCPPRVLVIDLDRGFFDGPLPVSSRRGSLARLYRSLRRHEAAAGAPLASPRDLVRFLRGYAEERWRAEARAVKVRFRTRLLFHRFNWLLESLFRRRGERLARADLGVPSTGRA